jgi:hypothetical protein
MIVQVSNHSNEPIKQRVSLNAGRYDGAVSMVSALTFMGLVCDFGSLAQFGNKHRSAARFGFMPSVSIRPEYNRLDENSKLLQYL